MIENLIFCKKNRHITYQKIQFFYTKVYKTHDHKSLSEKKFYR